MLKLDLAVALAEAHVEYLTRFSRRYALESFQVLQRFAEFASSNRYDGKKLKKVESISSGTGADAWRNAITAYLTTLEQSPIVLTTFAENIGNLFRTLDEFTSLGLAARCVRPTLPKNYHATGKHRPGLIEQSSKNPAAPELLAQLEQHITALNLPLKGDEAHGLLSALAAQVPANILHDEVALAEAIFSINAKALADIRATAEDTFIHWRDVWLKGQALLNTPGISAVNVLRQASKEPKHKANAPRRALFSPDLGDEAIGNFLRFFNEQFGPHVPSLVEQKWPAFMKEAFWQLGGREGFEACFCLHRRGVSAAVILYLVDSGANISTALNLTTDSEQETDDPNFINFVSFKDRAGPEPIVKQLPLKTPGVRVTAAQALRDVKEMTQTRRKMYPELLGNRLFVSTFQKYPSILTNESLADNFRYMLRDRQMPQGWTPSAIRIAVGVEVSGKTGGDLDKVGRKLSHAAGSATTPIYALRLAVRLLLSRKIREYQTILEAAFATHTSHGPQILGYSDEAAGLLVDKVVRTGLGFLCRDASARGGKVKDTGASCPELGRSCADCQSRVFIADIDSLAEIVAVNDSLSKTLNSAGEGEQDAWAENWLDLYAFSSAVIHKAKRSRFAYLMPAARHKAQELLSAGFDPALIRE